MIATSAMAADLPPPPVAAAPPPPMAAPAFDWGGLYVGVGVGTFVPFPSPLGGAIAGGVGYNFVAGQFVAGVQGYFIVPVGDWAAGSSAVGANGRAGVLIGDKLLAYGLIGINGHFDGYKEWYFGGGLELALGNSWSVFAELFWAKELGCMGCDFSPPLLVIGIR